MAKIKVETPKTMDDCKLEEEIEQLRYRLRETETELAGFHEVYEWLLEDLRKLKFILNFVTYFVISAIATVVLLFILKTFFS